MWSRPTPSLTALMLIASTFAVAAGPAAAQDARSIEAYGPSDGIDYGYAGDFVRGTYIGAPLTRVPRPSQLVPSPWSYGTYGIPTVSGIPAAPAGQPTLTVIDARGPGIASGRREPAVGGERTAGLRVIAVQVPRR